MNYEDVERQAAELSNALDEIAAVIGDQLQLGDEAEKLRRQAQKVRDDHFQILVVGEFKRGKSTLLNAMLGDDVLPRKAAECTAVVTRIQFGEKPAVRVTFDDGRPDDAGAGNAGMSIDEFRKKYELIVDDADQRAAAFDRFSHVVCAVLSYPVDLCRHRIELVDSPGLGAHKSRTQRTQRFLKDADAVVFVLHATQFLKQDESHFLESILLPMGLRNIFFVINGWNLIDAQVIRPEDADRERAELDEHIRRRLAPFCFVNNRDRSGERIFRVNALGALQARMRRPANGAQLAESMVPALEDSLQKFLVEDRSKARADVILGSIRTAVQEVSRYIATQLALANKSLAEIEAERTALAPKLDRLRGIRQQIIGYLQTQSATLQDRLVMSFQEHMKKLVDELPAEVEKFNLDPITKRSMLWAAITDWTKSEEHKFATVARQCLEPQVQRVLERNLAKWQQSVIQNEMPAVMIDVEKYLQDEAAEYHRVMREIEDKIGIHSTPLQIEDQVKRWLGGGTAQPTGSINLPALGVVGEAFGFLVTGILAEYIAEAVLHLATGGVTLIVSALLAVVRLGWREYSMRSQIQSGIVDGIKAGIGDLTLSQAADIRARVRDGFDGLNEKIAGSINEEITIIEASLQNIIDRKSERQYSSDQDRQRLDAAQAAISATAERVHSLFLQT